MQGSSHIDAATEIRSGSDTAPAVGSPSPTDHQRMPVRMGQLRCGRKIWRATGPATHQPVKKAPSAEKVR